MSDEQPQTTEKLHERLPDEPAISEEIPIPEDVAASLRQAETGSVLYAWQMQVEGGWNIIGIGAAGGISLPLVTTSMQLAWEALELAQAHANRNACQVRLAAFGYANLMAVVEPNE